MKSQADKKVKNEKTEEILETKIKKNSRAKKITKESAQKKTETNSSKDLGLHGIKKVFDKEIESSETKFHKGSLRSGNKIEYEGSLVILGDVNHGAEVVARDNIVVLGTLRGIAHAGAKGNKKAVIASTSIESPQVRISNIVKEIEKEDIEERKTYAYVEGPNIVLE